MSFFSRLFGRKDESKPRGPSPQARAATRQTSWRDVQFDRPDCIKVLIPNGDIVLEFNNEQDAREAERELVSYLRDAPLEFPCVPSGIPMTTIAKIKASVFELETIKKAKRAGVAARK